MVTYGDYFSRKVLYNCGISPDRKMFEKEGTTYTGMQRTERIRSDISEIYQTLYRGHTEKNAGKAKEDFANFQLEKKIVAAFYDSGNLSNTERDYFLNQAISVDQREQICVEEANASNEIFKAQKLDSQVKIPSARNLRQ